jgi:serine/threonine-protein kinase
VCVALFVQACDGLAAAHAKGVVHRDIKPSNIFLEHVGGGPICVKVTDFGLAKVEDALAGTLTTSGAFMGTAQYVSPEQATNAKHVDVRSDVWSLAMSLYHALTGQAAFSQTGSFLALVLELTGKNVRPLQDLAPWVDPRVARVVHAALLRDVSARCPSVVELAIALRMAVGADVADARPTAAALASVSPEVRAQRAPHAELVSCWEELLHQ